MTVYPLICEVRGTPSSPDLNSYTYAEWERDLNVIKKDALGDGKMPYIITSIKVAAWEGADSKAIEYFGIDRDEYQADSKLNDLVEFMHESGYVQAFCNDAYAVYEIPGR